MSEFSETCELYRAIHPHHYPNGEILRVAFRDLKLSVDRGDMCTSKDTLSRFPNSAAIATFVKKDVTAIKTLYVVHNPGPENAAHSEILGEKTPDIKNKLIELAQKKLILNNVIAPTPTKTN